MERDRDSWNGNLNKREISFRICVWLNCNRDNKRVMFPFFHGNVFGQFNTNGSALSEMIGIRCRILLQNVLYSLAFPLFICKICNGFTQLKSNQNFSSHWIYMTMETVWNQMKISAKIWNVFIYEQSISPLANVFILHIEPFSKHTLARTYLGTWIRIRKFNILRLLGAIREFIWASVCM